MQKICLTTFVYGEKYQAYIPFLIYSMNKAYPNYDMILFLYDKLDKNINAQIKEISIKSKLTIKEEHFKECPDMTAIKAKALRWVLWDDEFNNYDYIYTVDIDMLYIKEPISLHEQHIRHMAYLNLPISNIRREIKFNPFNIKHFKSRVVKIGFQKIFSIFKNRGVEVRVTGLHFINREEYYKRLDNNKRQYYKNLIFDGGIFNIIKHPSDEVFLARILMELEINIEKLALQTNSTCMLGFENPERKEFRPHHGIHMGIFRTTRTFNASKDILSSEAYSYYLKYYLQYIKEDPIFDKILEIAPLNIRNSFKSLDNYLDTI